MKNKNIIALVIIIVCTGILFTIFKVRVSEKQIDINDIIKKVKDVNSYTCNVKIEIINAREKNTYEGIEKYKKNVGCKIQLKDRTFIFKDEDIGVIDNVSTKDYKVSADFDEVLKYSFLNKYVSLIYTGQKLNFDEGSNNENILLVDVILTGNNRNLYDGIMYYDVKDNVPKKIVIFDKDNRERVVYTYENFKWTDKIEDTEFFTN